MIDEIVMKSGTPTELSNESPTAKEHNKYEQTTDIGTRTLRQRTFEIYIVLECFACKNNEQFIK